MKAKKEKRIKRNQKKNAAFVCVVESCVRCCECEGMQVAAVRRRCKSVVGYTRARQSKHAR